MIKGTTFDKRLWPEKLNGQRFLLITFQIGCVDPYTSIANNNSYVFKSLINRLERDGLLAIYWFEKNHMKLN